MTSNRDMLTVQKTTTVLIGLLLVSCVPALAQVPEPPSPSVSETTEGNGAVGPVELTERSPRVLYARDKNGNIVPLINVPLDRIQLLLDQADGAPGDVVPPQFQINRLQVKGTANGERAALTVTCEFTTLQAQEAGQHDWISVPLRFPDAALVAESKYEGPAESVLVFDPIDGYRLWLHGDVQGQHQIELKLDANVSQSAEANQLRFFCPHATVTDLELEVSGSDVSADIENARHLTIETLAEDRALIKANNLQNQVMVIWRDGGRVSRQQLAQLDVRGDIRVFIDGPGAVRSEASFDIKSHGRPIESFVVKLPPDTTLVPSSALGYEVALLPPEDNAEGPARQQLKVTLQQPAQQTRVQLTTQTVGENDEAERIGIANFEFPAALRQSGQMTLFASEDWLVYWFPGPSVRRVPGSETTEVQSETKRLATFEYYRQPSRLDLLVQPQGTRVAVEPLYRMHVTDDRVNLEARLKYRIRGARVSFLDFALNGWQIDEVGPAGAVENDDYQPQPNSRIRLRLTRPASGDVELMVRLHRNVTQSEGTLRFPLPWPDADAVVPGMLLVSSSNSVVLDYRLQEMSGLVQDTVPTGYAPTAGNNTEQPTVAFRFRSDRAVGDVVIDYQVRPQEISVRINNAIQVDAGGAYVVQRFRYRISFQPASRLTLDVPRSLLEMLTSPRYGSQLELSLDNRLIDTSAWLDVANLADELQTTMPIDVGLGELRYGNVDIQVKYPCPLRSARTDEVTTIPLIVPRDGRLIGNSVTISPESPLRLQFVPDAYWTRDEYSQPGETLQTINLASTGRPNQIQIRVGSIQEEADDQLPAGATVVRRAWLQSWLTNDTRLDRLVYRVATSASRLVLRLPEGADLSRVITLVDGREVTAMPTERELTIPLASRPERERTIEVSIPYLTRPKPGLIGFETPWLQGAAPAQRWFWQLVLPADEYLLVSDGRLTSDEHSLRDWWKEEPTNDAQAALESWTKSSQQPTLPASCHQYLFNSFERMDDIQVRTIARRPLVYSIAAACLSLGLIWVYVPWIRQTGTVLLLGVAMLVACWMWPSTARIIAETCWLGIILSALSVLTGSLLNAIQRRRFSRLRASSSGADSRHGGTASWGDSPPHSTATAPAPPIPVTVPDSKA